MEQSFFFFFDKTLSALKWFLHKEAATLGFLGFLLQKATDIVKDLKADVTAKETELQKANKVIFPFNLLSSITESYELQNKYWTADFKHLVCSSIVV